MPGSPANLRVMGNSPSSVLVSWNPPSTPNGVITSYSLYVNYSDGSPIDQILTGALIMNYTIAGLQPYQLISVQISANTSSGEGPVSEFTSGRTREEGEYYLQIYTHKALQLARNLGVSLTH